MDTCFYSAHSAHLIYIYGELECSLYAGKKMEMGTITSLWRWILTTR